MARKEDTVVTRVEINGKQAINQLGKLEMEASELRHRIKEVKKGTDEWIATNEKLNETKAKIAAIRKEVGIAGMTMQQLTRYQRELQKEINSGATRGTARYKELRAELLKVNSAIQTQRAELRNTSTFWTSFKNQVKSFALISIGTLGIAAVIQKMASLVTGSADLSDALSDVIKTTSLTKEEAEDLMSTFKSFNTRTPRRELLKMAEIAGRLGISGKKDIEGFVRAADQVNVALGDVLGDVGTVMKDIGKLTDTFGIQQVYGIETAILKVGSAINELGMASTANERNIVNFTRRLAGVAPIAKVSIANIMGMGATLDSLGQTVEVSGTAISRLLIEMAKNSEKYAKFARMEVSEFVKLMNEDANEAFIRVLEGVKDNSDGITELAATLGDLGLDGARVVGVFANLANNSEKLREQQKLSNEAFAEGISITNEFNLKNENLAANLSKVSKWWNRLWMNSKVRSAIEGTFEAMAKMIDIPVSETLDKQRIKLNALVMSTESFNIKSERRQIILKQIQADYPDFLKNLDVEKVTNEQLVARLKEVNAEMVYKIMLQMKHEDVTEAGTANAKARIAMFEQELKLNQHLFRLAEKHGKVEEIQGLTLRKRVELLKKYTLPKGNQTFNDTEQMLSRYLGLERVVESTNKKLEQTTNIYETLREKLGINLQTEEPVPTGDGEDDDDETSTLDSEETTKALEALLEKWREFRQEILKTEEDYAFQLLEKDDQELTSISQKFDKLKAEEMGYVAEIKSLKSLTEKEQGEHLSRLAQIEKQKQIELEAKREEFVLRDKKARSDAAERLRVEKLGDEDKEVHQLEQHYQELINLAQEYGFDIIELTEMREMAIAAIREKYRDQELQDQEKQHKEAVEAERRHKQAKVEVLQAYSQSFGAAIDLIGQKSGEMNGAQKALALVQIGIDTAISIMKAQVVALQAAAQAGKGAPFVYASVKASIVASVLTAAARAKNLLSTSTVTATGAQAPTENRGRNPSIGDRETGMRGYYFGGHTGGDSYGRFAGFVHPNEYVVPEYLMRDPYVADLTSVIESERRKSNFQTGGSTNTTTPRSSTESEKYLTKQQGQAIIDAMLEELRIIRKEPLKSYTLLDDYQAKKNLLDSIRRNANL